MNPSFRAETDLERRIMRDAEWQAGAAWGEPRSGHPEGAVYLHIAEVLANLDRLVLDPDTRRRLRVSALIHDSFKYRVNRNRPRVAPNEHGWIASRWAERFGIDDRPLLTLIELHDEGYRAWRAAQDDDHAQSARRIAQVIGRMREELQLFMTFYWADNRTGAKSPEQLDWFAAQCAQRGSDVTVPRP